MKQITFKEQVTIEQLDQRAKDGECVALTNGQGGIIWTDAKNIEWFYQYADLSSCSEPKHNYNPSLIGLIKQERPRSWTDTKTQLPVATDDVIHFSELRPGDCIEWHDDNCRGRGIVDEVNELWFSVHGWGEIFDDNTSATVYKLDLPPLNQLKEGVLRYKTLEELERDHYKDEDGNYYKNDSLHSLKFTKEMQAHACGKPSANSVWINQPWMTTTDPLT